MVALAGGLLAAACTGGDDAGPTPPPDPTDTTAVIDWSGVALAGVAGSTTTSIVETGTASIVGEVKGPSGPVVGATVRIERLVAGREIRNDIVTGPDGRYLLTGVPGGRYRLRAFLAPTLAQTSPEVRFLTDATEHTIDLEVQRHAGIVVRADAAPKPPLKGQAVNLVATVSNRVVTADGIVRTSPVAGLTVELDGLGRWVLREDGAPTSTTSTTSPGPTSSTSSSTSTTSPPRGQQSASARTDGSGRVRYELRCDTPGDPGLVLKVPVTVTPPPAEDGTPSKSYVTVESFALEVDACIDPATTTTTTTSTTTTEPPSSSTP